MNVIRSSVKQQTGKRIVPHVASGLKRENIAPCAANSFRRFLLGAKQFYGDEL